MIDKESVINQNILGASLPPFYLTHTRTSLKKTTQLFSFNYETKFDSYFENLLVQQ